VLLTLAGCSSGGGGSKSFVSSASSSDGSGSGGGGDGGTGGGNDGGGSDGGAGGAQTPLVTGQVIDQVGNTVGGVGDGIVQLGDQIGGIGIGGNTDLTAAAGGLISSTGNAVNTLGAGLSNGLGTLGTDANSLGVTVGSV